MAIEALLYSILTADPGVSALVGLRVYPLVVPQEVDLPAIAYQTISGRPDYTLEPPGGRVMLNRARIQLTCQGSTYAEAKGLALAVRSALSGYKSAPIDAIFVENIYDTWGEGFELPVVRVDIMVWYQEGT